MLECQPTDTQILDYLKTLCRSLESEPEAFVVRTALHVAIQLLERLQSRFNSSVDSSQEHSNSFGDTIHSIYTRQIVPRVFQLQHGHEQVPVRRWAAQTNERIWALLDQEARDLINQLQPQLFTIRNGRSRRFSKKLFAHLPVEKLGRIFGVLAQADFGYDIEETWFGYRIRRGSSFGFRLWRFYFEFTNTATDKRQALRHTTGRISTCLLYTSPSPRDATLSRMPSSA